ncbi:MAG: tetratricopeptide repeat protein [Gemmatimonadetes bacterium]|nr:tetratricopeptide repeat protein [Gemmatimonadota bacterium]
MSIETLKEQARRHEQREEWQEALDQYGLAIMKLAKEEQPDIGLYNRVGDLYVRVGNLDAAVEHFEQSVDLYLETFLPNNAIAVCKKIIRNVPDRHSAYLKMGQIRAEQGFLPDARANFLTYAERMQQAGDLDESFRALVEFCDLAPDDIDIRMMVADQMASHDRKDDAVVQLSTAYRHLIAKGAADEASAVEAKIRELDASTDVGGLPVMTSAELDGDGLSDADDLMGHFSDIAIGDSDDQESDNGRELPTFDVSDEPGDAAPAPEEEDASEAEEAVQEAAASEDYIDLGSMVLGDDGGEKSTRFTVAYEEPSGDEQADFAKMLSQFKDKVSENLGADDVQTHHDLGTAYKEMGLLEEAVGEFQAALRASADHLPTYELLGLTFMEMGRPEATVHSLERALEVKYDIEEELLGIYYYLARANEDLGKAERAVELYEKVFSIDINFADVTERLGDLR